MELLNKEQIDKAISAVNSASEEVMGVYRSGDFQVESKGDKSPVTKADKLSNKALLAGLSQIDANYTILSEEVEISRQNPTYWMVDPLDGTYNFIKKNDMFAVMVALMHNQKPVFGVIQAPALGLLYVGGSLIGESYKVGRGGVKQVIKTNLKPHSPLRVVASISHRSQKTDEYINNLGDYEFLEVGSGLKFCYVAEGRADVYVRFEGTYEWDTAAPQAIIETAGGVIDWNDPNHIYGEEDRLNSGFICRSKHYRL